MKDSRWFKVLVVLLVISFVFSIIPVKQDSVVRAATFQKRTQDSVPEPKKYRSVEKHSYKASVRTVSEWSGHANLEISFTNIGKETIHDWYFTFDYDYAIENPSNCYIVEHKDNLYTIANNNWNQDIAPGKSVKIGFTSASSDGSSVTKNPSFYLLNTKTVSLTEKELSYKFEEYSDWGSGFSGALVLTNASNDSIRDWTISFGANRPLTQADSASLKIKSDSSYTICNDGNNQNISKGKTYRIGIQGGYHDSAIPFELTGYSVTAKKLAIKLSEDKDKNGIADVRETDYSGAVTVTPTQSATTTPTSTPVPTSTNTPTPSNAPTNTPTAVPTVTTVPTSMPSVTPTLIPSPEPTVNPTPTATPTDVPSPTDFPVDVDYNKDSDSDGLPDDIENYYGTDKNKADTDGDGVNDLYEIILETDPLVFDSNGSKDADMDGLTNADESNQGTNPTSSDTDYDGITDGEEVNKYGTNPNKYDTDNDGMNDKNEIQLGSNPMAKDSDVKRNQVLKYDMPTDNGLTGVTMVTVSGSITGAISENTKIKNIYNKDLHTSSIEALVGNPVSIKSTGDFDEMTISFKYKEGLNEDNLRIMWYDETNCEYVILDNYSLDTTNKTISVTTNHFSKYMLIDEEVWVKTWAKACGSMNYSGGNTYNNIVQRNSGFGYTDYKNPEDFQKALKSMYSDGDGDGIVNPVEEAGIINNIGHIVKTTPSNPDSDDDGLNDGYEVGKIRLVGNKINDSMFMKYNCLLPVESCRRYSDFVYYAGSSDPSNGDSDSDGSKDGVDGTKNDANEPINYILYVDDSNKKGPLSETKEAYENYFKSHDMEYQSLVFLQKQQFIRFFLSYMKSGFISETKPKDGENYSFVENLVIIAHGHREFINLSYESLDVDEVSKYFSPKYMSCKIRTVDFQSCFAGSANKKGRIMAVEVLKALNAEEVYGATGTLVYLGSKNYVIGGRYYKFIKDDLDQIVRIGGMFSYDVMFRIKHMTRPYVVLDNYPF